LSAKRRVSKKKFLREPDEFITLWEKIFQFLEDNSRVFYIAVVALITLCACAVVFSFFRFQHQKKSAVEISRAIDEYNIARGDEDRLNDVLDDLNSILKDYPLTNQRKFVFLYRGHVLYNLGRYTEALSDYEKAGRKIKGPMKSVVTESIGFTREKLEDYEGASKAYLKILSDENESSYINLIRSLRGEGKDDEADKYSEKFLELFPESYYAEIVKANMSKAPKETEDLEEGEDLGEEEVEE
jgi:tetratricopeptide (TPR) repeat protein